MPVPKTGSFRYNFAEKSKERLLSKRAGQEIWGFEETENENLNCFSRMLGWLVRCWNSLHSFLERAWAFGKSDPRKIIFSAKQGLALSIMSLLIFFKEPLADMSRYSVWAILTVVVIFEFSIGATLSKGFNRGLGTLSAGGLALGMAELSIMAGNYEEIAIILSIFMTGFLTTFIKLYPTMKPYEYGFRVFLLTYCIVMVSGNRTREFVETAVTRFLLIALGAAVGLTVNICIYPIWAGEDLHNLVAKNFNGVANSLEGCVDGYLNCVEYERVPSKILTYQASDDPLYQGYRSAVESTNQEETLQGFAVWEPPHGRYNMLRYPWKSYLSLGGALRHCAFMVMALHGCILSEIQSPPERRRVFSHEMKRVGREGAYVLRELAKKLKTMEKLGPVDILLDVHEAAEELQKKIDRRSYLLVNCDSWQIGGRPVEVPSIDDNSLAAEHEKSELATNSLCQSILDFRRIPISKSWDASHGYMFSTSPRETDCHDSRIQKPAWPQQHLDHTSTPQSEAEGSKTYESASALSLATFTSLLIEFVARLQNLVDEFEELSRVAKFKEVVEDPPLEAVGFWIRLRTLLGLKPQNRLTSMCL